MGSLERGAIVWPSPFIVRLLQGVLRGFHGPIRAFVFSFQRARGKRLYCFACVTPGQRLSPIYDMPRCRWIKERLSAACRLPFVSLCVPIAVAEG